MAVNRITLVSAFLVFAAATAGGADAAGAGANRARTLPRPLQVTSSSLATAALATDAGGRLRVDDVEVPATSETLAFDVERFEVFASDVQIVVHGKDGDRR